EDQPISLLAQRREGAEQAVRLLRRQHLGGFIEDQNPRPREQLLEDFDFLQVTHREAADRKPEVDRKAQAFGEALHASAELSRADDPGQIVEEQRDILPDTESRNQAEVLEHHADADTTCRAWIGDRRRPARDDELARVGAVIAIEDLAERAL